MHLQYQCLKSLSLTDAVITVCNLTQFALHTDAVHVVQYSSSSSVKAVFKSLSLTDAVITVCITHCVTLHTDVVLHVVQYTSTQ